MQNSPDEANQQKGRQRKTWKSTQYANLIQYVPSGVYFARIRVNGKLNRRSLKTKVISVAILRLADFLKDLRQNAEMKQPLATGKMTFGEAMEVFTNRLKADSSKKPRTVTYRLERLAALIKSWPALTKLDLADITKSDCLSWAERFSKAAPSNFNNTVGTLRMVLDIAIEAGARYSNPASFIKKKRTRPKVLVLPTQEQFATLISSIHESGVCSCFQSADLIEFLAYGGFRKSEAAAITWADCDFAESEILVRGNTETGTKNWTVRRVPMIPDMIDLLKRLRKERNNEPLNAKVMLVKECQKTIDNITKKLGIPRITHHDLRHLFATRCIEAGVDIPTVSKWMGHKDGGALAMRTYGHLRNEHSQSMAQKVTFKVEKKEPEKNESSSPLQNP